MVRVHFIGCGDFVPRPGFGQAGLLLEVADRYYLFDCGDCVPSKLWLDRTLDWSRFTAIFVSHLHTDHWGGLLSFLFLLHHRAKRRPEWDLGREGVLEIYLPDAVVCDLLTELVELVHRPCYEYAFKPFGGGGEVYGDSLVVVEARRSAHGASSHAFRIVAGGRSLVYSGDIASPGEIAELCRGADLVIIEGAHFPLEEIPGALAGRGIGRLVITHLSHRLAEGRGEVLPALAPLAEGGTEVLLAREGMVVEV